MFPEPSETIFKRKVNELEGTNCNPCIKKILCLVWDQFINDALRKEPNEQTSWNFPSRPDFLLNKMEAMSILT